MAGIGVCYRGADAATLANPTTASPFLNLKGATTFPVFVKMPGGTFQSGKSFVIRASGIATTGATSNFLAKLQFTTNVNLIAAATAANNTDLCTLTNRSLATITRAWRIEANCIWDSTSQRLTGQFNGFNAETIETAFAAISALTAVDLTSETCGFVCAGLFGTGNAGNSAVLNDFSLEVL